MNSKERIRVVLDRKLPDRVPCHMNATQWVVEKLKKRLEVTSDAQLMEALHLDTYDMRGIDIHQGTMPRYIGEPHPGLTDEWKGNILDIWGVQEQVVQTSAGYSYCLGPAPLDGKDDAAIRAYPWPQASWFDYSSLAGDLRAWNGYGIIASGCSVWQHPSFVRGLESILIDMADDSPDVSYIYDRFNGFYFDFYSRIFAEAGSMIDIFALADDLGTQDSLIMSPAMIKRFIVPGIRRMADLAHGYGIRLLLHSDGNIRPIIPLLIDCGVDILDPLQPEAVGMDPLEIKREFGKDLVLRGGISVQQVLAGGSVSLVRDTVKRTIDILGVDGGYILSAGHPVLQDDVPVENIIAMYETAFEYGRY